MKVEKFYSFDFFVGIMRQGKTKCVKCAAGFSLVGN